AGPLPSPVRVQCFGRAAGDPSPAHDFAARTSGCFGQFRLSRFDLWTDERKHVVRDLRRLAARTDRIAGIRSHGVQPVPQVAAMVHPVALRDAKLGGNKARGYLSDQLAVSVPVPAVVVPGPDLTPMR